MAIPLLAFVEFWERFNKYAIRAFLVLYLIAPSFNNGGYGLGWAIGDAIALYSRFIAFAYITPLFGGFLSDKVLGAYHSTLLGCILIFIGQLMISIPHNWLPNQESTILCTGLFLFALGNGFFKPNIATLVGGVSKFYGLEPIKSYNLFFMITNLGGAVAGVALGSIVVWFNGNYQIGFFIAAIGMLFGTIILLAFKSVLNVSLLVHENPNTNKSIKTIPNKNTSNQSLKIYEKNHMVFIIIIGFFSIFFWFGYEQMAGSINIMTERFVDRQLFGFEIPTAWFQSLTPLFNILFAPVLYAMWNKLKRTNRHLDIPNKVTISLLASTLAFVILSVATYSLNYSFANKINFGWIIVVYFYFSIGEVLLSPTCLSAIHEYISEKSVGLIMGLWFMFYAVASFFAGILGHRVDPNSLIAISDHELFANLNRLFTSITFLTFIAAVGLIVSKNKIIQLLKPERV
ncbi:MFS transporter [Parashewanella spongiae]|uniref:peptide MFS transporter n=1 Tax=Parashewanella spongiae TaxID=342950 RepID=UPI001476B014|nr:MFS transporter [Parashewanella spongiae]MCL1077673.1 MFS transporter [Parashewanella spongiae]